jgi:hypothetical protein
MTRLTLLALAVALFAAAPAHALRTGEISVSASVVYSAVVRPVEVSLRQVRTAGQTRMVASVQSGAGPVLIEQRGGAPVQVVRSQTTGPVSIVLAGGAEADVIVTVFSDGAPAWHGR